MSTHGGHPIRKPQRRCSHPSPYKRHIPRQLRLLAPKGNALPSHPETTVQYRLQDQQPTEGSDQANDVNMATSQSCAPVSSGHEFTSPPLLWPGHTFPSLERTQDSAVPPYPNTYSNAIPLTTAGSGFPELSPRDLFPEVVTLEGHGLLTQHLPDGNLQLQEAFQNQHEHYSVPILDSPEEDAVWATMVQPTMGVNQGQCSIRFLAL